MKKYASKDPTINLAVIEGLQAISNIFHAKALMDAKVRVQLAEIQNAH